MMEVMRENAELQLSLKQAHAAIDALINALTLDDSDLQLVLLSMAECNLRRPGFTYVIETLAARLGGDRAVEMLSSFKAIHRDTIKPI